MPSPRHDSLIKMFADRPQVVTKILRDLLGADLPDTPLIRRENAGFNTRNSVDIASDLIFTMGPPGAPVHAVIAGVRQDKGDPRRLARHAVSLWAHLGCDVTVLLVCPDQETADHYAEPVESGLDGHLFRARVLGPADMSFLTGLMETTMTSTDWPVYTPWAREHHRRGREEGLILGRVEHAARSVLLVLGARGVPVTDEARSRIAACTDVTQLEEWLTRAAVVGTLEELFGVG